MQKMLAINALRNTAFICKLLLNSVYRDVFGSVAGWTKSQACSRKAVSYALRASDGIAQPIRLFIWVQNTICAVRTDTCGCLAPLATRIFEVFHTCRSSFVRRATSSLIALLSDGIASTPAHRSRSFATPRVDAVYASYKRTLLYFAEACGKYTHYC